MSETPAVDTVDELPRKRIAFIDLLRALTLISMIAYHCCWDLNNMFGVDVAFFPSVGSFAWQQSICCTFIFLSGYCLMLGHHPFKRGAMVFAAGAIVTIVTYLFMPADIVVFGVLTLIGTSMLITAALDKPLSAMNPWLGFVIALLLFFVFRDVNHGYAFCFEAFDLHFPSELYGFQYLSTFLGFEAPGFISSDYFSLLPWLFLFIAGRFFHDCVAPEKIENALGSYPAPKPLVFLGRHSLIVYLLHQPLIYLLLSLIFTVVGVSS